jgi:hypothetical protein
MTKQRNRLNVDKHFAVHVQKHAKSSGLVSSSAKHRNMLEFLFEFSTARTLYEISLY